MAQRLKEIFFTATFVERLATAIQAVYPDFQAARFKELTFDNEWQTRELKQKMRHVTGCLHETLPTEFPAALKILEQVAPSFDGFEGILFPDYVECYGLEHWEQSLPALGLLTRYGSSEFAIRPFLAHDAGKVMPYMYRWAEDGNHHVRRFASEGCRPRLPWGMALPAFKRDPQPILPVLETLKADESDYVRKSVANNLNDISKDHPDLVLDMCERWQGDNPQTDWIIKHACRTMLKAGSSRAMWLFGFADPTSVKIDGLSLEASTVAIGDELSFQFELQLETATKLRLEFGIYYLKANGSHNRKVFQIKEADFEVGRHRITKKHSFQHRTTRKHYPGDHHLVIIVNGIEMGRASFTVVA